MLKTLWCRISSPFFHNGPIWPHAAPSEWIVRNGCPSTIGCICDWKHLFPQPIKHPLASVCCNCADRRTCRRKMHRLQENRARKKKRKPHRDTWSRKRNKELLFCFFCVNFTMCLLHFTTLCKKIVFWLY